MDITVILNLSCEDLHTSSYKDTRKLFSRCLYVSTAYFNEVLGMIYSETWELGTPKGLPKTVLNFKVVLFLRFISMYQIDQGLQ